MWTICCEHRVIYHSLAKKTVQFTFLLAYRIASTTVRRTQRYSFRQPFVAALRVKLTCSAYFCPPHRIFSIFLFVKYVRLRTSILLAASQGLRGQVTSETQTEANGAFKLRHPECSVALQNVYVTQTRLYHDIPNVFIDSFSLNRKQFPSHTDDEDDDDNFLGMTLKQSGNFANTVLLLYTTRICWYTKQNAIVKQTVQPLQPLVNEWAATALNPDQVDDLLPLIKLLWRIRYPYFISDLIHNCIASDRPSIDTALYAFLNSHPAGNTTAAVRHYSLPVDDDAPPGWYARTHKPQMENVLSI